MFSMSHMKEVTNQERKVCTLIPISVGCFLFCRCDFKLCKETLDRGQPRMHIRGLD